MAGIYIHIPFCKQACHYCDFHFSTSKQNQEGLVNAISKEIDLQKEYLEREGIETIYFGGGTPSLLSEKELKQILEAIARNHSIKANPEITLEANPDDLSEANLRMLKSCGITRLSIGVQSFDDQILQFLNRAHGSSDALQCLDRSRAAGFSNISVDLIYAIPAQSLSRFEKNLQTLLEFSPEHISAYALTIEERTVFGNWQKKGKLLASSDEEAAIQMEKLIDVLQSAGYEHYEISNFSKPRFHSRHNTSYWQQKKYLGIGPSAHSFNGHSRQFNIQNNSIYIRSIEQNKIPFEREILTQANKINEYLFTTIRTSTGCKMTYLKTQLSFDILSEKENELSNFIGLDLITLTDNYLYLTKKGKLLADKIAADLFTE
ncbi:MAG TPA: coproporphyrinogen III oxidase [Cytophagales bacterium]|nr:coproporphyrinogen III oxidase [Cytophagales bacterium]